MSAAENWRLNAGDETRVIDGQNNPICDVKCGGMSGRTVAQGEKIARLIAAAPALLEALEKIARDRGGYMGEYHADCQQIARAAIALAKGESA